MNKTFLKNTVAVGAITLLSRISGFVRDFFTAKYLGAGRLSDCFFVAFKIPNLFRAIFAEGAFNSVFVPLFSGILHSEGEGKAKEFSKSIFAILFYVLLVFTMLAEIFMPAMVAVFAPGFESGSDKFELAVALSRITFPFLFFVAMTSFFGSILNSLGLFRPYAMQPIILNLVMIAALFAFGRAAPTAAHALAWGVSAAGVLQLAILAWTARRRGFGVMSFRPSFSPEVAKFFSRIVPGILSAGIYHVNVMVGSIFATSTNGAVSWIYYADRLNQLPLGVIGAAVATVMLPDISRHVKQGRLNRTKKVFNDSMLFTSLLVIPCAVGLMVVGYPLIQIFFERGAFKPADTYATARVLSILCLGLPALVYVKLLANVFYARSDTRTPMRVAAATLACNLLFTVVLNRVYGYVGVVAAITLSNWVGFGALYWLCYKRGLMGMYLRTLRSIAKIALVSLAMGALVWFGAQGIIANISVYSLFERIMLLAFLIAVAAASYVAFLFLFGIVPVQSIKRFFRK
ncbi:MAG: murein biosynthesis integral membrane protein MurJ [Rickettsiales bacterium]|jgi:putative peptidoglycan lipid II flippase|nr:murein biosynthesis integral membrane protein MurJ [Rickettsiales bacterium]